MPLRAMAARIQLVVINYTVFYYVKTKTDAFDVGGDYIRIEDSVKLKKTFLPSYIFSVTKSNVIQYRYTTISGMEL